MLPDFIDLQGLDIFVIVCNFFKIQNILELVHFLSSNETLKLGIGLKIIINLTINK